MAPGRPARTLSLLAGVIAGSLVLGACGSPGAGPSGSGPSAVIATPAQYAAPSWRTLLGGDQPRTSATWSALSAARNSDLPRHDDLEAATLAREVLRAELTGVGMGHWPAYFPKGATSPYGRCRHLRVLATSAQNLPVDPHASAPSNLAPAVSPDAFAKVLVVWQASCTRPPYDPRAVGKRVEPPAVSYLYEERTAHGYVPIQEWQVPGAVTNGTASVAATPPSYDLTTLSSCGSPKNATKQVLIEVADAWDALCNAAARRGVDLVVTSALRSPAEQAALFRRAVSFYGSTAEAKHWVAYANATSCTSEHCAGTAIDVSPTKAALGFLDAIVGCKAPNGKIHLGPTACAKTSAPVLRLQRYGFVSPLPYEPWYLAFALPLAGDPSSGAAACSPPSSDPIPAMVAAIFACRLSTAGRSPKTVREAIAEAEVVSRCESGWNSAAKAFGGRYQSAPDPANGRVYSQAGVFMLSKAEANAYVPGGYANDLNPIDNINGAAAIYLSDSGWGAFGCATGRSSGFDSGPVLPAYGGPALPGWALADAASAPA